MVDEANVADSGVVSTQETPVNSTAENIKTESAPVVTAEKKPEKVFTRDEVAKITNAETKKAVEKARREFETTQILNSPKSQQIPSQNVPVQPLTDVQQGPTVPPEQLQQFVQHEISRQAQVHAQEMMFQQAIVGFQGKMEEAQQRYPDYHETISNLELHKMPEENLKPFIALLNVADNGADVLYDISKNPRKLIDLVNLVALNPKLAIQEVQRLSGSIKENQNAAKTPVPNAPLSQITPSTTGTDNGTMTLRDMKKQPWARG
jgi:hypothetical protein